MLFELLSDEDSELDTFPDSEADAESETDKEAEVDTEVEIDSLNESRSEVE